MSTKVIAQLGMLTSVTLVLGYLEHMLQLAPTLPGVKLGLANTVLLYALYLLDTKSAFALMLLKVVLSGAMFGGIGGAIYSFAGGLASLLAMLLAKRFSSITPVGVSVIGAVFHNVGQLSVASLMVETRALLFYIPILLIAAIITGILTGISARLIMKGTASV